MVATDSTILTDRQVEVLELRERGLTQQEVAERLGTTGSNISAIERAADENIQKARRTLRLVQTIRAPLQFSVSPGTSYDDLVEEIYRQGDDAGINIDYCRPELYSHLYGALENYTEQNELKEQVEVGIQNDGEVKVITAEY